MELTAPQLELTAPQLELTAPQLELTAPQLELTARRWSRPGAQVELTAPQVEQTAPQVELTGAQGEFQAELTGTFRAVAGDGFVGLSRVPPVEKQDRAQILRILGNVGLVVGLVITGIGLFAESTPSKIYFFAGLLVLAGLGFRLEAALTDRGGER